MNLFDDLNSEQQDAVRQTEGPLLVVAGAGSGKTRVITYRILNLIHAHEVSPENILAITFTNKAAREMKHRIFQRLERHDTLPWVSTFHSLCLALLRQHIEVMGWPTDFVIYDAQDQLSVLKRCMQAAHVNEDAFKPRTLLAHISGFKNDFKSPEELDPENFSYGAALKAATVYPFYEKALRDNNALDFDDLLVMTVRLLMRHEEVRAQLNERFRYLLVDEFQDTNRTQYQLVQLLAGQSQNVCAVGDDDQSIYSWRGARLDNMLDFEKDFKGARTIKLEQNYRSTSNILNAAGAVVRENENRKDKTLWTENPPGAKVIYYRAEDEVDEARVASEALRQWNEEDGISFNELAVLYRTNAQSRAVEDHLRHMNLPYQVIGGLRFYERREVKDILAYMRVVINPADSVSLKRIINLPARGIGKATVDKIEEHAYRQGWRLVDGFRKAVEEGGIVGTGPVKKIAAFLALLDHLGRAWRENSASDFLQDIMERSGYLAMLEKENNQEARSRMENLSELYNAVEEFVETEKRGNLQEFLDSAALVSDQDQIDDGRGTISLMTLHTCKGLEFDGVVLVGLENGLLPHSGSMASQEQYEEERRLCYVGITRARQKLMLTNARHRRMHGNTFTYPPSDFLMAIPPELLQKESTPGAAPVDRGYSRSPGWDAAPPTLKPGKSEVAGSYAVGTRVLHPKFGNGVVVMKEGAEDDLKVTIFFKKAGKKKLAANLAKLIVL